jgi:hypothetical protein
MRWACGAHALIVGCYPERIRALHGDEMRQMFRDRCRDLSQGRIGAWQLFGRELLFDSAGAAVGAHLEAGIGTLGLRHVVLFLALAGTGVILLNQDTLIFPAVAKFERARKMAPWFERELEQRRAETKLRGLAEALIAKPDADDRALGAWMLAAYPSKRVGYIQAGGWRGDWIQKSLTSGPYYAALPKQGRLATLTALQTPPGASRFALAAAAAACHPQFGCMDGDLLRRLAVADPGNAHAAFRLFKDASLAGNEAGMSTALALAATATHHDDYQDAFRRDALRAAIQLHPGDDAILMAVGHLLDDLRDSDAGPWENDLRRNCYPHADWQGAKPTFLERHPERVADCTRVGALIAHSKNQATRHYGRAILVGLGAMDRSEADRINRAWRDQRPHVGWSRVQFQRGDPPAIRWTAAQWASWARQEAAGADG